MATKPTSSKPDSPLDSGLYRSIPLAAVILGFAVVGMHWTDLPYSIPIHFDLSGRADGYGSKWLLWILPVVNLGLFYAIGKTGSPAWRKYMNPAVPLTEENSDHQLKLSLTLLAQVRLIVSVLLSYLAYSSALAAVEGTGKIDATVIYGLLAAPFLCIGMHMWRASKAK